MHDIPILHADPWLLVIEKPAGLLSVPGRLEEHRDCVITRLQQSHPDALTVHRLDQVTSGLMVFAREIKTHRALSIAFAQREIDKRYEALVEGVVETDSGRIELPLARDWPSRPRQIVDHANGKPATTDWRVIERIPMIERTRVSLHPLTGRTHQLRVHMAESGHPIAGDVFYGAQPASRVGLHATRLAFRHPHTDDLLEFASPAPF